jgi:hypothetical protein
MNFRQLFSVVPKPVRIVAAIIVGCSPLTGMVLEYCRQTRGHLLHTPIDNACGMGIGVGLGLLFSALLALWLLAVGYVYGDARRRTMRPVLWVLVTILSPNLLGFLFYFALRQPIAAICANCGQKNAGTPRFCSWCGHPQPSPLSNHAPSGPGSSGLDSMTIV